MTPRELVGRAVSWPLFQAGLVGLSVLRVHDRIVDWARDSARPPGCASSQDDADRPAVAQLSESSDLEARDE